MVILSEAVIKPYKKLLKITQSKKAKRIDNRKGSKSFVLPVEARYWDEVTETHYGCSDVVNGARLLQLIYRKVSKIMNNAEESIGDVDRSAVTEADQLLTASLVIKPSYMFDRVDFFKHDGKEISPLNRRLLIKLLKQKIGEFSKHTELSL